MDFQDRAPLEKVRRLADGRIAAIAKIARSGVYRYAGHELGRPDLQTVNVYRPEAEVFDQASLASFAHKSVTLGHPSEPVTADNWRKHSVGYSEGKIARDGDFIEIPLMLADSAAVAAVENGTAKQISAGYRCELIWADGIAPSGEPYSAKQVGIVADHIALVREGRAGPRCAIGDAKKDAEPASIDEALRNKFDELAKGRNATVTELLSSMAQKEIEEVASDVAVQFVRAQAAAGIASAYGDSAVHLAKAAANAMRRDALAGGTLSGSQSVRDAAQAAQFGDPTPAVAALVHDSESLSAAAAARDAARASQYR